LPTAFSIYDILLIIGISQGLITSILLFTSKKNIKSSRFLALGLIAFCFLSAKSLLLTLGLWNLPYVRFFPNAAEIVIGPLIYFYLVYLLDLQFQWKKMHYLHFLPFFISQSLAIFIYVASLQTNIIAEKEIIAGNLHFNLLKTLDEYIALVMFAFYLPRSHQLLQKYRKWLQHNISDSSYPDLSWLRNIFILSFILGLCLFFSHALDLAFQINEKTQIHWKSINIFIAFVIYYLGFVGYKQPQYHLKGEVKKAPPSPKLKLASEREQEVAAQLETALVDDKIFLDPTVNIQQLSAKLGLPSRELSTVINKVFKKNFRDLINEYRVEEVKFNIIQSNFQNMSLVGLAYESGFNSEASFYRIFKKKTGLSPKEFRKKYSQN